jgi:hypothetical protein
MGNKNAPKREKKKPKKAKLEQVVVAMPRISREPAGKK